MEDIKFQGEEIIADAPRPSEKWGQKGIDDTDPMVIERRRLANIFLHHAPKGDQSDRYETLRMAGLSLANQLIDLCPNSRERSLALTKLEEAIFFANASIARNE